MPRLIDANAYKASLTKWKEDAWKHNERHDAMLIADCLSELEAMPTVDAVEVVHGRWEHIQTGIMLHVRCTACGVDAIEINTDRFTEVTVAWDYCPNCGAKMRGSEE